MAKKNRDESLPAAHTVRKPMAKCIDRYMKSNFFKAAVVLVIFAVYFVVQFPSLMHAPWEDYTSWRQGDTYSIAQNYYRYSMNPLRPQFNYDAAEPVVVQLELQILPYISAVLFKIIGGMTPFVPRLLAILFFCGSAWYLYKIVRRFASYTVALMALVLYLITPINTVYSRAIMPEAVALFFFVGAIWYLLLWYEETDPKAIWLSGIFCALAIMEKTPTIFLGILVLFVFFWKLGWKAFKSMEFYGYGLIALGVPGAYYLYAGSVATMTYVSSIASNHILSEKIFSVFTKESAEFFGNAFPQYFGIALLAAAFFGFVLVFNRKDRFFAILGLSFLLEVATIVAIIKFAYYLVFISPIVVILVAKLVDALARWRRALAVVLCAVVLLFTWNCTAQLYPQSVAVNDTIQRIGAFVDANTEPDAALAFAVENPVYINASNRNGFRANIKYHSFIPVGAEAETDFYIQEGVDYFVALNSGVYNDPDGTYRAYLDTHFPVHAQNELCTIYKLQEQ